MFTAIEINSSYPQAARPAIQKVIGRLNMYILNAGELIVKGNRVEESSGSDAYAAYRDVQSGLEVTAAAHEDNGLDVREPITTTVAKYMMLRTHLANELIRYAGMVKNPLTGRMAPNMYDLGQSLESSFDWRVSHELPFGVTEASITASAKAMRMDPVMAIAMLKSDQAKANAASLSRKAEIFGVIHEGHLGQDNMGFSIEDPQTIFESLEPMIQLKLIQSAIEGCRSGQARAFVSMTKGFPNAKGDYDLIEGVLEQCFDVLDAMTADPKYEKAMDEAQAEGKLVPVFGTRPLNRPLDPAKQALLNHKARGYIVRKGETQPGQVA